MAFQEWDGSLMENEKQKRTTTIVESKLQIIWGKELIEKVIKVKKGYKWNSWGIYCTCKCWLEFSLAAQRRPLV